MKNKIILGLFALGTLSLSASNEQGKLIEKEISSQPPIIGEPTNCYEIKITTIYSNNYAITHSTQTIEYGAYTEEGIEDYIEQLRLNNPDYMSNGSGHTTLYYYKRSRFFNCYTLEPIN